MTIDLCICLLYIYWIYIYIPNNLFIFLLVLVVWVSQIIDSFHLHYNIYGHSSIHTIPLLTFIALLAHLLSLKNFFSFIFISWRLITLQYCSGFCHTLTWISHRFTCVPHPDPPSCLPPHPIPLGLPSAPALSTCLMHPTWAGDRFTLDSILVSMLFSQNIPPSPSPTESKSLFCTSVSLCLFSILGYCYHLFKFHIYALVYCIGLYLSGLLHSV